MQQKGFGEDDILQAVQLKQQFDQYARTGDKRPELEAALASAKAARWFTAVEDVPDPLAAFERLAWWRAVLDFDPLPYIQQVQCPLLAVFGEQDAIVNSQESAAILRQLPAARTITVKIFERANHGLMVFAQPNEPFRWFGLAENYLETVASWISMCLRKKL
jgi:pimeloyl-ACP methyl ester carboxylesterase